MIKFDVYNRFTGKVQFSAEIDCNGYTDKRLKLRLAIKWALEKHANLRGADLRDADLRGADLRDADLRGANLRDADLCGADLFGANLCGADLRDANLRGANLRGANLRGADLCGAVGEKTYIKTLQIECYPISYTSDILQIGCKIFLISEWWEFTDDQIAEMDGYKALAFWRKWKDWLRDLIEVRSPAEPTGYVEKKEGEVK